MPPPYVRQYEQDSPLESGWEGPIIVDLDDPRQTYIWHPQNVGLYANYPLPRCWVIG
jgi:hypothetical protein